MERLPGEKFKKYRERRKAVQSYNKRIANRGILVWNSSEKGTYVRPKKKKNENN